jgi:hypothetical protein
MLLISALRDLQDEVLEQRFEIIKFESVVKELEKTFSEEIREDKMKHQESLEREMTTKSPSPSSNDTSNPNSLHNPSIRTGGLLKRVIGILARQSLPSNHLVKIEDRDRSLSSSSERSFVHEYPIGADDSIGPNRELYRSSTPATETFLTWSAKRDSLNSEENRYWAGHRSRIENRKKKMQRLEELFQVEHEEKRGKEV